MFILDRPSSDKPTSIFLKKKLFDGDFKEALGVKILPAIWNKKSERAEVAGVDRLTALENKSINALLAKIETFIIVRTQEARHSANHLTCVELSAKLQEWVVKRKKKVKTGSGFFNHCALIVKDMREGEILTKQNQRYTSGTLRCYEMYLDNFKKYDENLSFKDINLTFYRSFVKWCNDNDFSMNYIGQHINKLLVLMKEAKTRKWHNNTAYMDGEFKSMKEDTDDVTLSPEQLEILYHKEFPEPEYDLTRDWAIINAYVGLRASDIDKLDDHNLVNNTITIANEKTNTKVSIPLRPEVKAILKKWNGLPPKIHDNDFNANIKEVCKICGFDSIFLYFLTKGGARRDFYMKLYEMVSRHTFRRCFITHLLNAGVPDNQVMQLAGIKKHATLLRYKKTKPEETANIMQGHDYFKGTSKPASKWRSRRK